MSSGRLGFLLLAALLLVGGYAIGQALRGDPSRAAPVSCPYSGGGPAFVLQSFEADRERQLYLDAQRLAAANQLFPDDEEFQLQPLHVGEQFIEDPSATIPPVILQAIGWIESKTNQTSVEVAYGELGPALISFDCGYGIMQVTSSLLHDGGRPSRYEALVGTHFAYNIAAGARILVEKWNQPLFPIIGSHDPSYLESWYYALWAYNGWAGINHPAHPNHDPFRSRYDCNGPRNGYPYQELVFGCFVNPPAVDGLPLWESLAVSLPDLAVLTAPGAALDLDIFYAGLDNFYISPADAGAGAQSPFAAMNMPLPSGAQPRPAALEPSELLRLQILGVPHGRLDAEELELSSTQLESGDAALQIYNDGTGLLAWRIADAPTWLSFDVQAGVALGAGYAFTSGPRSSRLNIAAAAGGVPEGSHRGRISIEFHYPDGTAATEVVTVSLDKRGAAFYEAGRPQS